MKSLLMADAEQVTKAIEGASDQAAAEGLAGGEMQGPPGDETPAADGEAAVEEMGKTA